MTDSQTLARLYGAMLALVGLSVLPQAAQSQNLNNTAAQEAAAQRSQRQADNVYRWIRMHAEPARKPDTNKPDAAKPRSRPESPPMAPTAEAATPGSAGQAGDAFGGPQQAMAAPQSATPPSAPLDPNALLRDAPTAAGRTQLKPAPEAEEVLTILAQPQPDIPRDVRNQLGSGKVMLAFTVQPNGSVTDASVVTSSHRRLNRPALDAVAQWKFAPIRTARAAKVELEFDLQ